MRSALASRSTLSPDSERSGETARRSVLPRRRRSRWANGRRWIATSTPSALPSNGRRACKTAVSICLGSRYPDRRLVGQSRPTRCFYNDGYRPDARRDEAPRLRWGARDVNAGARSGRSSGRCSTGAVASGEATWSEDLLLVMDRNGYARGEATSPSPTARFATTTATVAGIFCACYRDHRPGDRRASAAHAARAQPHGSRGTDAPKRRARSPPRTLGENTADIPFALIYLLDGDGRQRADWSRRQDSQAGSAAAPHEIDLRHGDRRRRGRSRRVLDALPPNCCTTSPRRSAHCPAVRGPSSREAAADRCRSPRLARTGPTGFLVGGLSPRRAFDDEYRSFLDLVAGHDRHAPSPNARAYEEERRRAEALAELDRAKTAFFSNVSHEFRTPLTLMLGPLEDAARAVARRCPTTTASGWSWCTATALRLLKLVNTLLDFSRIEAGRIEASYEPTDLAACTAELASVFRSAIERAGLRLVVDCPPLPEPVYVDREMWEKIVLNLLSNAFKFTFEGEIGVSLRRARRRTCELDVRDTGHRHPGGRAAAPVRALPPRRGRARAHLRGHAASGWRWCRSWCKLHGGTVRGRERARARHARFIVTMPLGSAHLPADRIERRPRAGVDRPAAARPSSRRRCAGCRRARRCGETFEHRTAARAPTAAGGDEPARASCSPTTTPTCATTCARLLRGRLRGRGGRGRRGRRSTRRARRTPDLVLTRRHDAGLDGFGLLRALRADRRTRSAAGHPAVGARRRGGARRGAGGRRRRLPGQAVLARASCWRASKRT